MRPSLDEVVKRKKQTHSVEASAMVFTQQGKPSERGVSMMEDRAIRRAIVFLAVLMFRIVATGKVIRLNNNDYLKLTQLKDRDFSAFE